MKSIHRWIGLDRTILFALMARGWSMFAGVCNIVLISRFLSPAEQGYFYTFASLVAIQIVFEMGFSSVILQVASHERARLSQFDNQGVTGDPVAHARLASVFKKTVQWYSRAGLVMGAGLLFIGIYFFSTHSRGDHAAWLGPWCLDALATAAAFIIDPALCFLEGCGWVTEVAQLRFPQVLFGSLLGWACLLLGHGLYAPGMMIAGQVLLSLYFVFLRHGKLLSGLLRHSVGDWGVRWKEEVWPFQWRVALTWASTYFILQIFNPVLFAYAGPVIAGRMGMSLNICSSLAALSQAWINTKAARFGTLVATRQTGALNIEFRKATIQSTVLLISAQLAFLLALFCAERTVPAIAHRVIGLPLFALLLLSVLMGHLVICQSYYLRAHKEEPFLWFWIAIAIASVIAVGWGGKYHGALGVTVAYLLTGGLSRLAAGTYVFLQKRRQWYGMPIGRIKGEAAA